MEPVDDATVVAWGNALKTIAEYARSGGGLTTHAIYMSLQNAALVGPKPQEAPKPVPIHIKRTWTGVLPQPKRRVDTNVLNGFVSSTSGIPRRPQSDVIVDGRSPFSESR